MVWTIVAFIIGIGLLILEFTTGKVFYFLSTKIHASWIFIGLAVIFLIWDLVERKKKKKGGVKK